MTNLSNALEYTYPLYTNYDQPKNIVVVGAGGTGGYLIPNLARQVALQNKLRAISDLRPHTLTIIEADEVELKNLTRQNFIERDIEKNKGQVLAERYGAAFGLTINFVPEYIESKDQLKTIINRVREAQGYNMMPVLVDCVDNNATRQIMHEAVREISTQGKDIFFLSSGNEEWSGQVICTHLPREYTRGRWKMAEVGQGGVRQFRTPILGEMFPETMQPNPEEKLPTQMSCAERAVSAPQNILTNMVAANLLFTFLNTILTANSSEGEGLKHFAVMFDAQNSVYRTLFNKKSEIEKYVK